MCIPICINDPKVRSHKKVSLSTMGPEKKSIWREGMSLPRSPVQSSSGEGPVTSSLRFLPPPVSRITDTGLSQLWLQDLALKILYFRGYMTGFKVAEAMALPFAGLVDQILEALKREKYVEVKSQVGFGEGSYQYAITSAGIARGARSARSESVRRSSARAA